MPKNKNWVVPEELLKELDQYIQDNYVAEVRETDTCYAPRHEEEDAKVPLFEAAEVPIAGAKGEFVSIFGKQQTLEDAVSHLEETFQERLLRMIDERGLSDPEVYKKAGLDRKHFSKIRCNPQYSPRKRTAVALTLALQLNLDDSLDLLGSAGYVLTRSSVADVIVRFCISNGIYDIDQVNALLDKHGQPLLG